MHRSEPRLPIAGLDELDGCRLYAQSFAKQQPQTCSSNEVALSMLGEAKPGGSTTFRI
jgi:hypothetical protein